LPEVAAAKKRKNAQPAEARVSTTDADARNMKMGDGGFRPAYNVQFATVCAEQVIVGVDVVTAGSDMAQLAPMVEQVDERLGQTPAQWLVDGGYPAHKQIDAVHGKTEIYAPVPKAKAAKTEDKPDGQAPTAEQQAQPATQAPQAPQAEAAVARKGSEFERKPGDSDAVAQWRERMDT